MAKQQDPLPPPRASGSEEDRPQRQDSAPAALPVELRDLLAAALIDANEAVMLNSADLAEARIEFVNPAFAELTGYSAEEVIGRTAWLLQGPKTDRGEIERAAAELAAGRACGGEVISYRKDGSEFWLEWRTAPVHDAAGRITHCVTTLRDSTARRAGQEAAERSSLAKTQFLGRMSHELLTPLNSLIGFPEMLIDGHFGPLNERQHQAIRNVLAASEQLRSLIQDLLDLARIEAGRLQLEFSRFDLGALLSDFTGPIAEMARRKGVTLGVDIAADLPQICGDPHRLKQVALNLLDNAVKYTSAGGSVHLRLWGAVSAAGLPVVRMAVADSGVGIRLEDRERIFRLFEQVDPSLTRRQPGTGLGLALVTRILDLHGGQVWVESAGEGAGSTFHVELPGQQGESP
jgi:PAS domain S-box-containing protein